MNELSKKRRMAKMESLRDVALEHCDSAQCDECKIRDLCDYSYILIGCSWLYLAGVATGRIYKNGRLRKMKNYPMNACNELFNNAVEFRKKYGNKCYECPILKECTQLDCPCYSSFLLCVIFGIIDVYGERKERV